DSAGLSKILADCDILICNSEVTEAEHAVSDNRKNCGQIRKLTKLYNNSASSGRLVLISNQSAAGPSKTNVAKTEDEKETPVSAYGKMKLEMEQIVRSESRHPWTIIRPAALYGSGDKHFLHYFRMMYKGICVSFGTEKRFCLTYIKELARSVESAINNPAASNEVFNTALGESFSQSELFNRLSAALGKPYIGITLPQEAIRVVSFAEKLITLLSGNRYSKANLKDFESNNWRVNTEKAERVLGFRNQSNISRTLLLTYRWYLKHHWLS
ncbi:MAG: NAD(P)-dependent oxidoreductase, partial [Candidatus Cloacimonetes bacterium]|nr:NAD(P)-dependent oxidoreductase [Candidatus Cloacimonadota bacterium]